MSKTKTFVDSDVLIYAFRGEAELCRKAMEILDDPEREFIASDYLKLELLPKPIFHQFHEEVEFMQAFFDSASLYADATPAIADKSITLACRYNLSPLDALHAGTAIESNADVLVTGEKPENPLCQIQEIKVLSLRS
jgi:predicted nucleic acid-binding protein